MPASHPLLGSIRSWFIAVLVPLASAAVACTSSAGGAKVCTAGSNVMCRCENRQAGTKRCDDDGESFGECRCSGEPAASTASPKSKPGRTEEPPEDPPAKKTPPPTDRSEPPAEEPQSPAESKPTKPATSTCGRLGPCCDAQRKMGITGSADACDRVVDAGDPSACERELEASGTPDDYYDPPAECR